jgi:hypothetical protein
MKGDFMLWRDTSKESLEVKIKKAVAHFHKKYGKAPEVVGVCPQEMKDGISMNGLVVKAHLLVLPGHLFVGMEE